LKGFVSKWQVMFMFVEGLRAKEAAKKQEAAVKLDQEESPDAQPVEDRNSVAIADKSAC
jgi:hypothetical protein